MVTDSYISMDRNKYLENDSTAFIFISSNCTM